MTDSRPDSTDAPDTRGRILDAAERLFAEQGIAASSVRAITREAGVNLAAVSYHFGSKEGLVHEVLDRRLGPLHRERRLRLEQVEERHRLDPPPVEEILEAFLQPVVRVLGDPEARTFARLLLRAFLEPSEELRRLVVGEFLPTVKRYEEALARSAPHLPHEAVLWRLHFTIGALAHTAGHGQLVEFVSEGRCRISDVDRVMAELVRFAAAGFAAEGTSASGSGEGS